MNLAEVLVTWSSVPCRGSCTLLRFLYLVKGPSNFEFCTLLRSCTLLRFLYLVEGPVVCWGPVPCWGPVRSCTLLRVLYLVQVLYLDFPQGLYDQAVDRREWLVQQIIKLDSDTVWYSIVCLLLLTIYLGSYTKISHLVWSWNLFLCGTNPNWQLSAQTPSKNWKLSYSKPLR